jgi:hypothetical protein
MKRFIKKMPRRNDDNDTERKGGKFSKNVKFSREKSFAYSEADIERNDAKLNAFQKERSKERKQNLKVANGVEEEADDYDVRTQVPKFERKYYLKMNLVVNDVPADYDIDKLCTKFEKYGNIQYVSKELNANGSYNAVLVPDEWNELIRSIQQDIFDKGSSEYKIKGFVYNITGDSTQEFEEYGEAIDYEEDDDSA